MCAIDPDDWMDQGWSFRLAEESVLNQQRLEARKAGYSGEFVELVAAMMERDRKRRLTAAQALNFLDMKVPDESAELKSSKFDSEKQSFIAEAKHSNKSPTSSLPTSPAS